MERLLRQARDERVRQASAKRPLPRAPAHCVVTSAGLVFTPPLTLGDGWFADHLLIYMKQDA